MRTLHPDRYKWIALLNATLAVLLATLDGSITIIAMPDIFRGIHRGPLVPANSFYLLWMILGYLVVTSVLIVSLGRFGDMGGTGQDLPAWLRDLHRRVVAARDRLAAGPRRGGVPDRLPRRAGDRWGVPAGQRGGDHHRRVPRQPAGNGTGHQQHRRRQRHLHRPGARRRARPGQLASGVPDLGARRDLRNGLGLLEPAGAQLPKGGPDRLGGQRDLCARPDPDHRGGDVWHPAGRRTPGRLGQSPGARPARSRRRLPDRVRARRAPVARPDVPSAAVPDPRVHVRHPVDVPVVDRARGPDVHADHLAPGDLATPARLRLHADTALGRYLHAAADRGAAVRRPRSPATFPTASVRGRSRLRECC
jgi:hypothetical protein